MTSGTNRKQQVKTETDKRFKERLLLEDKMINYFMQMNVLRDLDKW